MAFDFGKMWAMAFGAAPAKVSTIPTPEVTDENQAEDEETTDTGSESESETETEAGVSTEKSGLRSDASKDIGSDDTMMDVHTQVLDVSHSSVLARPHPPPPRYLARVKRTVEVHEKPAPSPAPIDVAPVVVEDVKKVPFVEIGPRTERAVRAIREKKKPWYKRVLRRKTKEEKQRDKLAAEKRRQEKARAKALVKAASKDRKKKKSKPSKGEPKPKKEKKKRSSQPFWKRIRKPTLGKRKAHSADAKKPTPKKKSKQRAHKKKARETAPAKAPLQPHLDPKKKKKKKRKSDCHQQ